MKCSIHGAPGPAGSLSEAWQEKNQILSILSGPEANQAPVQHDVKKKKKKKKTHCP